MVLIKHAQSGAVEVASNQTRLTSTAKAYLISVFTEIIVN